MWTRKQLKEKAKGLFRANYWKAVLAALVLAVVVGSGGSVGSSSGMSSMFSGMSSIGTSQSTFNSTRGTDFNEFMEESGLMEAITEDGMIVTTEGEMPDAVPMAVGILMVGMILVIALVIAAVAIALDILLFNPLEVGVRRFFTRNLHEKAQVRELAFAFDHSYRNILKVMFFRDLFTFLWSLLFIIPGIVKSYEYRMIPYLLAEYPDMSRDDAFAISRQMMSGNKWKTFVLDLSFILWILGSVFTLGLLGLFYGDPYMAQTGAVLYETLKAEKRPFAPQPAAGIPAATSGGNAGMNSVSDAQE